EEKLVFTFDSLYPFKDSQISFGGILLNQINPKTMMSANNDNIYLIGEVLDQNYPCGGYNMGHSLIDGFTCGKALKGE
ncbi:MAG: NAD(P)/FAD-dependent oxidoreductase, partial [Bacilli bacterium]